MEKQVFTEEMLEEDAIQQQPAGLDIDSRRRLWGLQIRAGKGSDSAHKLHIVSVFVGKTDNNTTQVNFLS